MGGEQVDDQVTDGVPPSVGATDHEEDGKTLVRRIVGLSNGRGGNGICGYPPHLIIHQEAADNRSVEGGLSSCLCILHRGGEYAGDNPDGALVGSRRDK